jgi:hypothetical protein
MQNSKVLNTEQSAGSTGAQDAGSEQSEIGSKRQASITEQSVNGAELE